MRNYIETPAAELEANRLCAKRINEQISPLGLKYHIEAYGCQMNGHDSERIAGMLVECGFTKCDDKESADFIIFNTCCVRDHAEQRVFGNVGALKALKDANPRLIIAVCGCMMQQEKVSRHLYKRFPYVDIIFGTNELHRLPTMIEAALMGERTLMVRNIDGEVTEGIPILRSGTFSTNVNIMFGCNNFCSYCIVPYVRGRERSRSFERIFSEVEDVAKCGFSEITLLGQNVNSYCSPESGMKFPALLDKISVIDGIERIRFMTSHPKDLSDELIEVMATNDKVCKHIHLPVQSGSTRILEQMNRRYSREHYLELVRKLRQRVQDIEITTDIIVGFPGETEEDFNQTLSLVREVGFSAAFTFMYSPRPGTKAASMPNQIDPAEKKRRLLALNAVEAEMLKTNNQKFIGKVGKVLVEGFDVRDGQYFMNGRLSNFKSVYFPYDADEAAVRGMVGKTVDVNIVDTTNNSLIGELNG